MIGGSLICLLMSMYWEHKHFKEDCIKLYNKTVEIYGILKNKIREMKARRKGGGEAQSDGASEAAADKSAPAEETQPSDGEEIKN